MKLHPNITPTLQEWIAQQHIFFVASAPSSRNGHVNLSPKGYSSFCIIDDHTVAYQDMTGSGNETSAHISENGRLTIMFCGMEGGPRILRLYGRGEVLLRNDVSKAWNDACMHFQDNLLPGTRQIIILHVDRVQTSCGYAVPYMDYKGDRNMLKGWAEGKSRDEILDYQKEKNVRSIDGIKTPLGEVFEGGSVRFRKQVLSPSSVVAAVLICLVCIVYAHQRSEGFSTYK